MNVAQIHRYGGRHEAIMPLFLPIKCFLAIPFILTNYAQNYAHKFNEIMICSYNIVHVCS